MNKKEALNNVKKTISDYNLIADKFSSTRDNLPEDIVNLKQYINEEDTVLDYGCGNGRACRLFTPKQYLGVDPSENLINIAKSKYEEYKFLKIEPSKFPAQNEFDIILCLSMIHHLTNREIQEQLIKDFYDRITHKGKLIITTWNLGAVANYIDKIVHVPFKSSNIVINRMLYSFSLEEFEELIKSSGFKILDSKITPRNRGKYSNIEIIATK